MSPLRAAVLCLLAVALASGVAQRRPRAAQPRPTAPPEIVDLNHADLDALETLPGIGPERARRILRLRRDRHGFRSVDELLDVPGVGPQTLEALRPRVFLGPAG